MEDEILVKRIATNDSSAFNKLIIKYYSCLLGFASSILKNEDTAKDIVQEMFVRMWENRAKLVNVKSLRNYMYVSIRNIAINYIRSEKRLNERHGKINFEQNNIILDEIIRLLTDAIEQLPARSAMVMKLTLQGLSLEEIAVKMGVSQNTVRSTKAYAISKLRKQFEHNQPTAMMLLVI